LVHRDTDHSEPPVFILALKLHKPRDLDFARPAPGGPEIQQHDLAFVISQAHRSALRVLQREIRRRLALFLTLSRLDGPGGGTGSAKKNENNHHAENTSVHGGHLSGWSQKPEGGRRAFPPDSFLHYSRNRGITSAA